MADLNPACARAAILSAAIVCIAAGPPPAVTLASHDDTAQVAFAFSNPVGFGIRRQGNQLFLHFSGAGAIPPAEGDGRNVTSILGGDDRATLAMAPGTRFRTLRKEGSIIIEVSHAKPPPLAPRPVVASVASAKPPPVELRDKPAPAPALPAQTVALPATPPPPPVPAVPPPPPNPAVAETVSAPPGPPPGGPATVDAAALVAVTADMPAGASGTAAALPFGERVGAAAFRRAGAAWVVFDQRHQLDFTGLPDNPVFSRATVQLLPNATLLRLPLDEASDLRLSRGDGGWTIAVLHAAAPPPAINVVVKQTRFELPAADVGDVVTVPDGETGQNLLVGTLRGAPLGMPVARRAPALILEPTWLGVVVEPIADTVTMRATADGFVVGSGGETLSPAPDGAGALANAAFLTRRFDIPTGSPESLLRRLQTQVNDAGEAPAQARAKPRKAAATTMIALGMGVEAEAMLHLATEEDPRLMTDADVAGLGAIAALLGGRPAETEGIVNPALDGSDEVAFWRAVRTAQAHEGAPEAASVFAATVNLLLAYPAPLRAAMLPLVVETMALGGAGDAADATLARLKDDPSLDLARAIRQAAKGNTADALARYDTIALGRDRLMAARAANRATKLRMDTEAITPTEAASAMERQFYDWRGDDRELDLRLRVAGLRAELGAWRPAFALLRETAVLYPESADMIQARMAELMTTLVKGPASAAISPLELVALTEENAELVANIGSAQVAGLMADKLLALDLPRRAGPVLERMMRAAPVGPGQAALGARLAALRLGEGDIAGTEAALANSNAPGLSAQLIERRTLISARLAAQSGHLERAKALLVDVGTASADDMRASLMADAQDWRGAASALADLAAKTVPPAGKLTPSQQDSILRLASALSRSGDMAGLQALAAKYAPRLDEPRAGVFRLLTAPPVSNVADLPRASTEMALAKAIPVGLTAIGSR